MTNANLERVQLKVKGLMEMDITLDGRKWSTTAAQAL